MGKCCHIYNLMHDVETAMLHYLEISTEILAVVCKGRVTVWPFFGPQWIWLRFEYMVV